MSQTRTVTATVNFFTPPVDGSKPYYDNTKPTGENTNTQHHPVQVEIEDLRGKEASVSLDTAGFQFGVHTSAVAGFYDEQEIRDVYYPESVELIKRETGASHVLIFDHSACTVRVHLRAVADASTAIRRRVAGEAGTDLNKRQPARFAHVDQTPAATIARVHRHLPAAEAADRVNRRVQIINLWRPINHPAFDHPLALCDFRTVDWDKDLVPTRLIYADREGETFSVAENANQRWKYVSGLRPDEYVLIKW
jgi:hypothetical protein